LFEIKKAIKSLGNHNLYKKNNFTLFFPKSNNKFISNNSIIMQKSSTNFEISNRNKIINAMQKIHFSHLNLYSKTINELNKSKGNLFSILVSKKQNKMKNKKFTFKGLYEISPDDDYLWGKYVFGVSICNKIINIKDYENIFNFDLNKGEFVKYKFDSQEKKIFNCSTIIIY